jgi:hypothetical protein
VHRAVALDIDPRVPRKPAVRINHGSIHARDPRRVAADLAHLVGGLARPFHPWKGAWVCFLGGEDEDWEGPLIELYPHDLTMVAEAGRLAFRKAKLPPRGVGSHFNLSVPRTRRQLEALCAEREIACSWRDWQGLLEVWLEPELLVELVPCDGGAA